ncbi:MAG: RNA 2',3'-cyclic phosphodiesterase [Methylococcaceae bacterium]|jgi:2'-5' RNA ligase
MPRLFLALFPDAATRQQLQIIAQSLNGHGLVTVSPESFHVTLVFLGSIEEALTSALAQKIANLKQDSFELVFDQLSFWQRPRVLSLTGSQIVPAIRSLQADLIQLMSEFNMTIDSRPYVPHVTLAKQVLFLPDIKIKAMLWGVRSFCLVESMQASSGVRYQIRKQWQLANKN